MIAPQQPLRRLSEVCVPPEGRATVTVETPEVTGIYRDPVIGPPTGVSNRPVGIHVRTIALADETEPVERCPT